MGHFIEHNEELERFWPLRGTFKLIVAQATDRASFHDQDDDQDHDDDGLKNIQAGRTSCLLSVASDRLLNLWPILFVGAAVESPTWRLSWL